MRDIFFNWPGQIVLAFLLDFFLGDPEWLFHPVRWMGKAVEKSEPLLRRLFPNLRWAGIVLVVGLVAMVALSVWTSLVVADAMSPWLGSFWRIYLFYAALSTRCLAVEVRRVLQALQKGSIKDARHWLSRIVGRDTQRLDEQEVLRASLETTAESTVDGIVSVLFYSFLGGPILAMVFKAVSTLDSMVGYKNEQYGMFGWASARLDDIFNYLPARLGAVLICLAGLILGKSPRAAWHIVLRDAKNQPSPNSGYPEAAFAGALGVQLGGENFYQGQKVFKPALGESKEKLRVKNVEESVQLMFATSVLCVVLGVFVWCIASR